VAARVRGMPGIRSRSSAPGSAVMPLTRPAGCAAFSLALADCARIFLEFRSMQHRWFACLGGLAALAGAFVAHAGDAMPVASFHAEYAVSRNGKEIGHATLALRPGAGGIWEFSDHTEGTQGMASLLGLDVTENSTFRWRKGLPEGLDYRFAQKTAFKSRKRSTQFDWQSREATSEDGKRHWSAPLQDGAMDRNLVTIALMAALKSGARELAFPVVDKDRVAEQRYRRGADETLSLPAGRIEAVRVDRQRENSRRSTTIWFAPRRDWLPVQIEQVEKNGETVTLRLASAH
jgi:hypothetical protein